MRPTVSLPPESVGSPLARGVAGEPRRAGAHAGDRIGSGLAQRAGFLPVSWSDNIYGVIGELGLLGTLFIVLLFALLASRAADALRAPDNLACCWQQALPLC
jgi:hypothetical protein